MNKILVVLSMVVLGLSISACGKKADDSTTTEPAAPEQAAPAAEEAAPAAEEAAPAAEEAAPAAAEEAKPAEEAAPAQ